MSATLLQSFLYKVPLVLPLSSCHIESAFEIQFALILFRLLPLQLLSQLNSAYLLYLLISVVNSFFFKGTVINGIVFAARIVDVINRFLKVSRPLENLYVCSRIKGLRIHR